MRRDKGNTGILPARGTPLRGLTRHYLGLCLGLCLPLGSPTHAANSQDASSESAPARIESNRNEARESKEVRPALARRKRNALSQFDPKAFEARGRELQDEYYEIATMTKAPSWSSGPTEIATPSPMASSSSSSRNWIIWTGAAGIAALVGGTAGYLMLERHTAPEPITVRLDDKPE